MDIVIVVKQLNWQVEQLAWLKADARKLLRLVKRVELVCTDLEPYVVKGGLHTWKALKARVDVAQSPSSRVPLADPPPYSPTPAT